MPNTIQLKLLDNKQIKAERQGIPLANENSYKIKAEMQGIPLANENSYKIIAGEENATIFAITSKPTQYASATYTVEMVNSQGYGIEETVITETTEIGGVSYQSFKLPKGMAVAGYGYIQIKAYTDYVDLQHYSEKVPFQPLKVKVWNTIPNWKEEIPEYGTPATQEWVEDYVESAMAEIDLSDYYTKTEADTLLGNKQNTIDSSHKLSADLVTDTSATNKFVSASDKAQINKIGTIETSYGATLDFTVNTSTYVLTAVLKNKDGTVLSTQTVDLPLESVVVNGSYNDNTKSLILTLQNGNTITIPVGDLISGLVPTSRTIAGLDLSQNRTASELLNALFDVSVVEGV